MPAQSLNEIMVETYKKFVLVSLIVHGDVQTLPKYTANLVQRFNKNCCAEYNEIATACYTHEVTEVQSCVEKHKAVMQRDNNYGLAKQVLEAVYSRNIQRLTQTFVTLSLGDISEHVKLGDAAQAKKRVLDMIERNMIVATIDEQMGMVSFDTEPDKTSSQQLLLRLTAQIQVLFVSKTLTTPPHVVPSLIVICFAFSNPPSLPNPKQDESIPVLLTGISRRF